MIASSKVMTTNTDPPRQQQQQQLPPSSSSSVAGAPPTLCPSFSGLLADLQNPGDLSNQQSMSMDDILKNIYSSTTTMPAAAAAEQAAFADASLTRAESRSVKEVWDEIVAGGAGGGSDQVRVGAGGDEEITLEAFLTKAGAVTEEDVRVYGNNNNNIVNNNTGNVSNISTNGNNGVGVGRGKRRVVEAPPVDKATQQKQRRMIKNRESAARSRERKQAHTVELESLVTQLEEENARLLREEAEQNKERYKQLMENLIPVVDKKRSPRVLRRVQSSLW